MVHGLVVVEFWFQRVRYTDVCLSSDDGGVSDDVLILGQPRVHWVFFI